MSDFPGRPVRWAWHHRGRAGHTAWPVVARGDNRRAGATPLLILCTAVAALILVGWRRGVAGDPHRGDHRPRGRPRAGRAGLGRRLDGVRVHRSTAGLTVSAGNASGPGIVATAAAGYLAPPLLGLGGAALLAGGHWWPRCCSAWPGWPGCCDPQRLRAAGHGHAWRRPWPGAVARSAVLRPRRIRDDVVPLVGGVRPVLELQRARHRGRARGRRGPACPAHRVPGGLWVAPVRTWWRWAPWG